MRRSVQFFVAAIALALGVSLVAQSVPVTSFRSNIFSSSVNMPSPDVPLVVLYDQTSNPSTNAISSQNFEASLDAYDDQLADDFVVPGGQSWSVQQVNVQGVYYNGSGPADSFHVTFYADAATLPGPVQCDYASLAFSFASGTFSIPLTSPCALGPFTHWVSVQANQDFTPNGQWGWLDRITQSNSGAAWRNPGDGFGTGCTNFGRRTTCIASDTGAPDQIFQLLGVVNSPTAPSCAAWQVKTPTPAPDVYGASATSAGVQAFMAGGYSFSLPGDTNAFRRYDSANNSWTTLANVPDTTATMASAVYSPANNKVYVFGGEAAATGVTSNATRIYDIGGNSWSAGANMPDVRSFMASGYYNGKIYLIGGYTDGTVTSAQAQVWEYDPVGNTWNTSRQAMPHALGGPGFGIINGHIYVAGGRDAANTILSSLWDYDIAGNAWTQRASLLAAINVPGSSVVGGQLWLSGGGNPFGPGLEAFTPAIETTGASRIYKPAVDLWSNGPSLNAIRSFVAGTAIGNRLFAAGGYTGSTTTTTTETASCAGMFDFDADAKTDRTVFRPSNGVWYTAKSSGGAAITGWGVSTDTDVAGDYDGDGKTDIAVFRPSTGVWYIIQSSNGVVRVAGWGVSGDIPLAGDVDGDGKDDLVIFRPSAGAWFFNKSGGGTSVLGWGISGDQPLVGDYDGDGKKDAAIYRPSTGVWYIALSGGGTLIVGWGSPGDIPVVGDFDGDGKADVTIFRPSTGQWFINKSTGGSIVVGWGTSGDTPVSGDWDADGKSDFTIWRPSTGVWFTQFATGGSAVLGWGISGDKPSGRVPGS